MKLTRTMRNICYVIVGVILAKGLGSITSLYIARALQPESYGIFLTLMLIISYSGLFHLGTIESMTKQCPYYLGKGEPQKAREVENNVLGAVLLASVIIVSMGVCLSAVQVATPTVDKIKIIIMSVAAAVVLVSVYFTQRLVAHQLFEFTSIIDTVRASITLLALVVLTWKWGLSGTVWGVLLTEALVLSLVHRFSRRHIGTIRPRLDFRAVISLVQIGLPITLIWWFYTLQATVDRLISMSMLGKAATGYYGLGTSMVTALVLVPKAIGQVLYPKISDGIGKNLEKNQLAIYIVRPAQLISFVMPYIIGIMVLLCPFIYQNIFPLYLPGLNSALILLLSTFFACLTSHGVNYLVADNKQNILLVYTMVILAVKVGLTITLIKYGLSIDGIAISACIASAVYTTMIMKKSLQSIGYDRHRQLQEIFQLYTPYLIAIALISVIRMLLPLPMHRMMLTLSMQAILFTAIYSAVLFMIVPINKRIRELSSSLGMNSFGKTRKAATV